MNDLELKVEFTCKECSKLTKDIILVVDYKSATYLVNCDSCGECQTYKYNY
jgi:transcription elongation factor Elf1